MSAATVDCQGPAFYLLLPRPTIQITSTLIGVSFLVSRTRLAMPLEAMEAAHVVGFPVDLPNHELLQWRFWGSIEVSARIRLGHFSTVLGNA